MDFAQILTENFVLVVFVACLIVGYILKNTFEFVDNKYIPTILAFTGALINVLVTGVSVETIVYGAFMGLASTGAHQAFTRFINKNNQDEELT